MSVRSRIGIGIGMCAMVSLLGGNQVSRSNLPSVAASRVFMMTWIELAGLSAKRK